MPKQFARLLILTLLFALLLAGCTVTPPQDWEQTWADRWDQAIILLRGEPAPLPVDADGQAIFDFPVEIVQVERVVDGDTIVVAGGERVRYIGMDTPEMGTKPRECFAEQAKAKNVELVGGQTVALRMDVSERDRYKRLLRYVYRLDGAFVNAVLVQQGYATAATFPPDVLFSAYFTTLEREARTAGVGLWGSCTP